MEYAWLWALLGSMGGATATLLGAVAVLVKTMSGSYSGIVDQLRLQNTSQQQQIDDMRKDVAECRSTHEKCQATTDQLRRELDQLRGEVRNGKT